MNMCWTKRIYINQVVHITNHSSAQKQNLSYARPYIIVTQANFTPFIMNKSLWFHKIVKIKIIKYNYCQYRSNGDRSYSPENMYTYFTEDSYCNCILFMDLGLLTKLS